MSFNNNISSDTSDTENEESYEKIDYSKTSLHKRYPLIPHVLLLLVQFSFSGWHVLGSVTLKSGAEGIVVAFYREIFASILMYYFCKSKNINVMEKLLEIKQSFEDMRLFCFLGVCSFINVVFTLLALKYISATRYAVFQPSIPCFGTLISIMIGIENFTILKAVGILLAIAGAVIVETWKVGGSSSEDAESSVTAGTILVIIQCIAVATLLVFQKYILVKYDSSLVTFVYYTIGTFITILVTFVWLAFIPGSDMYFNGALLPWLALIYASLFATAFNYNAYSYCGNIVSPSIVTVYSTFQPVGTVILSFLVLQEVVTYPEIIGGILVIAGLLVTVYARSKESGDKKDVKSPLLHQIDSDNDNEDEERLGGI